MLEITSHPAIREGLVTVEHTIPDMTHGPLFSDNKKLMPWQFIDPGKVKYVVINPHSPSTRFQFSTTVERYLPQDSELWEAYVNSENDSGVYELAQTFLDKCPGGLLLTVEPTRGLIDANRSEVEAAIRNVLNPEATAEVRRILALIHQRTLGLIYLILKGMPPDIEIIDLHSMEPYSTPNQPLLRHDSLSAYIAAYKTRPLNAQTFRPVDIVTGPKDSPPITDMQMNTAMAEALNQSSIPWGANNPYDTSYIYTDFGFMINHPDRVVVYDFRKTDLCFGSGKDRSFDTTNPVVDPKKVDKMSQILAEAWNRVSFDRKSLR